MVVWSDIAGIVFVATTINHLGLISAIEGVIKRRLVVVNCPKCLSFWSCMFWLTGSCSLITMLAVSLLASYSALWLELAEAYLDTLYMKLYEKITQPGGNVTAAADPNEGYPPGSVS